MTDTTNDEKPLPARITPITIGVDKNWHVDDWLDVIPAYFGEEKALNYVHFMLEHFRRPAVVKLAYDPYMRDAKLFVTYVGVRYRVTGASRLGDIYLQPDFNQEHGYTQRVPLNFAKLTDWSDQP